MARIALAPLLTVADDVDAGAFLIANRQQCGVILGARKLGGRHQPQVACPHPRDLLRQPRAIDEPFGLRVGADQAGGEHHRGTIGK